MSIEWFIDDGTGVAVHTEDPRMMLIGDGIPNWVKAPKETPEIGERLFKVREVNYRTCAMCQQHPMRELVLDNRYRVAHCPVCEFVWYQLRG